MIATKAYAAQKANAPLTPFSFERRDVGPDDVQVEILYCGVCHSDLHQVKDEWGGSIFPMVPGHEIVGRVVKVGSNVTKFKEGDFAGVGVMVDSCRVCKNCAQDLEQYCVEGMTGTYNAIERDGKTVAQGGYSSQIVTDQKYVLKVSPKLDLKAVAPLLCAGITTYSPLRYVGVTKGTKVGVVGLGGLGHMAVKFAVSFGAEVTMLSTSKSKEADARKLGAHKFALTTDKEAMEEYKSYFDVILNTVSANHSYEQYLDLLDLNGKMVIVGLPPEASPVGAFTLLNNRRSIIGSMIGGIKETQEMLDYCAEHNIVADVELIPMNYINEAYDRMLKNDVKYRFVLDLSTI
ncbi:NAD(P)-dependent alcohol dehydrogenase [Danxiaibacter flavus]|uniref:NAD(P)-dependent alcohol dehydrogenase n=1 Tax=Danxiaibacter flavus TaxID=3049108 RepID=A0ABV3Z7X7_9BACT|nr:NAD(P)-dependent alcohol dehydrogenase [Chitinophagaceae bacterium DXS]